MPIATVSYLICMLACLSVAAFLAMGSMRRPYRVPLLAAMLISAAWAGVIAAEAWFSFSPSAVAIAEVGRNVGWLVLLVLVYQGSRKSGPGLRESALLWSAVFLPAVVALAGATPSLQLTTLYAPANGLAIARLCYVVWAVVALVVLENIYRNREGPGRAAIKYLCFGLGGLFAYDFFLYSDAILFQRLDPSLFDARGLVDALAVVTVAVSAARSATWASDIQVSRQFVFHTASFVVSGLYLLAMASLGVYIRRVGGDWGPVFQIVFLAGAVLILAVIFSSRGVRARFRVFISKNFFSYKYDYRQEWLRFIGTISADGATGNLRERILRAVGDIVDCRAGGLWMLREADNAFFPVLSNGLGDDLPVEPGDSPFIRWLGKWQWVVDLRQYRDHPSHYHGLDVPPRWRDLPNAWLIVPLIHNDVVRAILVLAAPPVERSLNWEDHDLLKTVGRQAASYLAEEAATNALADIHQLEAFNQRFAFVIHDIKNLTSQLALMMKNAEKHGANPDFQRDMLATVGNSVSRMRVLLEQLNVAREAPPVSRPANDGERLALPGFVERVGTKWRERKRDLAVHVAAVDGEVRVEPAKLAAVLDHLLQNALDAAGGAGNVSLSLRAGPEHAIIEVEDDGPGMEGEFIRNQLFRPLRTTKSSGYGIGAYQARELVREMGGRIEVESEVGRGTVMRVVLPLAGAAPSVEQVENVKVAGS